MKTVKQTAAQKLGKTSKKEELITAKLKRGIELTQEMNNIKSKLEEIKEFFAQEIFKGEKTKQKYVSEFGIAEQTLKNDYEILAQYMPALKDVFKKKVGDFVTVKSTYRPTATLRALSLDGDYENKDLIREAINIKTTIGITFKPISEAITKVAN